jgi:hypothetical protein
MQLSDDQRETSKGGTVEDAIERLTIWLNDPDEEGIQRIEG